MQAFLLSVHVVAGILFVGPIAVATSLFPRYVPVDGPSASNERSVGIARLLHRITRVYGLLAIAVPVIGLALAGVQGRSTEVWIIVAMVLTAGAGGLLAVQIAPRQRQALAAPGGESELRTLAMVTGIFNLLWVIVVVLMVVHPGSRYV
ncbi:hypothetical protein OS122_12040 [Mycolicibacterium mucogenicum]|jgi:hypothetical protein|uniref:hypothetical protein n=1 Tax=Mycolicibacterium TaxID=1866885 RepID=UPI00226AC923|nr:MULTISPECIES: hypothetical protein [Mycolicibacterium]MCX8561612.1 hypothetical protein [Mycolicibacterium mucogenicum]